MAGLSEVVLAIDPGPVQSAWLVYNPDTHGVRSFAISPNDWLNDQLASLSTDVDTVVIEQIRSYGMSVGAEIFDTVWWSGRFAESATRGGCAVVQLPRLKVKQALCHDSRAKDANIRQALLDRFGGKDVAVGRKASPGPLYGVSKDVWSALAIAVTYAEGGTA